MLRHFRQLALQHGLIAGITMQVVLHKLTDKLFLNKTGLPMLMILFHHTKKRTCQISFTGMNMPRGLLRFAKLLTTLGDKTGIIMTVSANNGTAAVIVDVLLLLRKSANYAPVFSKTGFTMGMYQKICLRAEHMPLLIQTVLPMYVHTQRVICTAQCEIV